MSGEGAAWWARLLLPRPRLALEVCGALTAPVPRAARGQGGPPVAVYGVAAEVATACLGWPARQAPPEEAFVVVSIGGGSGLSRSGAYRLRAGRFGMNTGCGADIVAGSIEGGRAGLRTLAQLVRLFPERLPGIDIVDAPALPVRGVMLDVSRCRIPTMEEFGRVIPLLASLKFNHLQLYTEHTFAYRGHREVWEGWDPVTPEEVRTLAALCERHGMTLGANQNCFGHMQHWLDRPRYAHLAETHGEFDFYGMRRRGPFSLCPIDPGSLEFVEGLLDELCPAFGLDGTGAGPVTVNIGCDETADVGAGRSRDAVAARGKAAVYGEYVASIMRHALGRGWKPQFWADIAMEHPRVLAMLPREATALAWGYEPDTPFDAWGRLLAGAGRDWWVCPGTSSWRSITGRTAERRANIAAAARAGVAHGASGFMVCDWGDVGHMQQWPVALAALADAADAAWTGGRDGYDPRAASVQAFGEAVDGPGVRVGPWLEALGDADEGLRGVALVSAPGSGRPPLRNASSLFSVLWPAHEEFGRPGALGDAPAWEGVGAGLETLAADLPPLADALVAREIAHTLEWAGCAARVGRAKGLDGAARHAGLQRARRELEGLEEAHAVLWPGRSRAGGLDRSRAFWRAAGGGLAGLEGARG